MRTFVYPVSDIARAKALWSAFLGVEPYADAPYYVGFRVGDQEVGLDPNGHKDGPRAYWDVDDIEASVATLVAAGAEVHEAVRDVGGGKLIASVKDADGNVIALAQSA
jgi:predicted enzyme related to lactoylglutathione lyase